MSKIRILYRNNRKVAEWHDDELVEAAPEFTQPTPDENKKVYIQDDTCAPLEHPCDGRVYDSKSQFRRVTKEYGCVELGTDIKQMKEKPWEPKGVKESIVESMRKLKHL